MSGTHEKHKKAIDSLELRYLGVVGSPVGGLEIGAGPLQQQQVLFTAELSL